MTQHEGKQLTEAELEAIRKRLEISLAFGDLEEPDEDGNRRFDDIDRRDLLQHIAWLMAQVTYEQERNSNNVLSYSLQVKDLTAKLTSAEARCKTLTDVLEAIRDIARRSMDAPPRSQERSLATVILHGAQQALSQSQEVKE